MKNITTKNYVNNNPIHIVTITINGEQYNVPTLLDTGCNEGIILTKNQVKKLKLNLGKSIDKHPSRTLVADGTIVGTYHYDIIVEFDGEKKPTILSVLHPKIRTKVSKDEQKQIDSEPVEGLLGRQILDDYRATFTGSQIPKYFSLDK